MSKSKQENNIDPAAAQEEKKRKDLLFSFSAKFIAAVGSTEGSRNSCLLTDAIALFELVFAFYPQNYIGNFQQRLAWGHQLLCTRDWMQEYPGTCKILAKLNQKEYRKFRCNCWKTKSRFAWTLRGAGGSTCCGLTWMGTSWTGLTVPMSASMFLLIYYFAFKI